jgi:hypothetical protein
MGCYQKVKKLLAGEWPVTINPMRTIIKKG